MSQSVTHFRFLFEESHHCKSIVTNSNLPTFIYHTTGRRESTVVTQERASMDGMNSLKKYYFCSSYQEINDAQSSVF